MSASEMVGREERSSRREVLESYVSVLLLRIELVGWGFDIGSTYERSWVPSGKAITVATDMGVSWRI